MDKMGGACLGTGTEKDKFNFEKVDIKVTGRESTADVLQLADSRTINWTRA